MNVRYLILIALLFSNLTNVFSQADWYDQQWSEARIELELQKCLNPVKVLYIAAHPDDENTRLISWLENDRRMEVAYLSLTNGSGGQNLIGPEISADLGLIREQELYAARRIDGGVQFFTSALDFGYSKTANETLKKWDKQKVLGEMVKCIRQFEPDIIITRFSPTTEGLRSTHGHHTSSAILAVEAFEAAADPTQYPEQLENLGVWKTRAIYWNSSRYSYGSQEILDSLAKQDPKKYIRLNVESYVPMLGMTCSEIAAESRSMHKSQGFGTMARYGVTDEYLELLAGDESVDSLFSLSNKYSYGPLNERASWEELLKDVLSNDEKWNTIGKLMLKSFGVRLIVNAANSIMQAGTTDLEIEFIHFADSDLEIIPHPASKPISVKPGEKFTMNITRNFLPYEVSTVEIQIEGISLNVPVVWRTSDPVKGEIVQPVTFVKAGLVKILNQEILMINDSAASITVEVMPLSDVDHIAFHADLVNARTGKPKTESQNFNGEYLAYETYTFVLTKWFNRVDIGYESTSVATSVIKYDHLPWIYAHRPIHINYHEIKVKCSAKKVGYVVGAGDQVPEAMEAMGLNVTILDHATVTYAELQEYDAIVFGVRALNVHDDIRLHLQKFYDYASAGGTLIMQYNTSHRLQTNRIGPLDTEINLSRERVTEEDAEVKILVDHVALHTPNEIRKKDWDNWVQERGLYFPSEWSAQYVAPLGMHDQNEPQMRGSLLITKHGNGYFVYTGISFFRNLPAGVEGAYRLWANLLSL